MEYQVMARLPKNLDRMVRGYLECAEFAGLGEEDREALELSVYPKWSEASLAQAHEDCEAFFRDHATILESFDERQIGHDFYLTRNGHGAGFWEGDYPKSVGQVLTDAAHVYRECEVWFDAETETLSFE